jgi:hypothetical protein
MSKQIEVQEPPGAWTPPPAGATEESAWQAWIARGGARDQRGSARRVQSLKCVLTAALLAAAGFWAQPPPYEIAFRLVVSVGAFVLMVQALRAQSPTFAVVFAATVWLYNPIAPVFTLAGDWQRTLVLATTVPLILSFGWDKQKQAAK